MKILLAIMCSPCSSNTWAHASLIFTCVWAKLIKQNQDKFMCDVAFFNHGHNVSVMKSICNGLTLYSYVREASYHSGLANFVMNNSQQYDYVILCEHDSFLQPECANSICDYLNQHQEVNFVTVNSIRSWWGFQGGRPRVSSEYPWLHQQASTGFVILKKQLFADAMKVFKDLGKSHIIPFNSNTMTYGEICSLLGKPGIPDANGIKLGLDGPFSVDFFTCMNKAGIVPAEVVNSDGRSLLGKTRPLTDLTHFSSFNEVIDGPENLPSVAKETIIAPFFHLTGGHTVAYYFREQTQEERINLFENMFKNLNSLAMTRYCLISLLTQASGHQELVSRLEENRKKGFSLVQGDQDVYQNQFNKVKDFYQSALKGYY